MQKIRFSVMISAALLMGWILFFQATQIASSSPLLGFTLTPTQAVIELTQTQVVVLPTQTQVVITPTQTQVIVTPTQTQVVVTPTQTPVAITPTNASINTLPPPAPQGLLIIPVTGTVRNVNLEGAINLGLILVAFGMIAVGVFLRKK